LKKLTGSSKGNDPKQQPVVHLFRTPANFGRKLRINQFERAPNDYFENIAVQARKILRQKMLSGELKKHKDVRKGVPWKLAVFLLAVIGALAFTGVYANWQGTISAQTTMRAPLYCPSSQITLNDVWINTTRSTISDNICVINTQNRMMQFTVGFYLTATFPNGTKTQDMTRLFNSLIVKISDYSQNMTSTNLLTANNPVSFSYQVGGDRNLRLLISYSSKNVQLGGTGIPLVMTMNYSFSGQ